MLSINCYTICSQEFNYNDMKRLSITFLTLVFVLLCYAQEEHLKFMGIPLDGKIKAFHSQLINKGCKLDPLTGTLSDNFRSYNGLFAGESAQIIISFEPKSKIVYSGLAAIKKYSESTTISSYEEMKSLIISKYSEDEMVKMINEYREKNQEEPIKWFIENKEGKYNNFVFIVPGHKRPTIGYIKLYISENDTRGYTTYNVCIAYVDEMNEEIKNKRISDDL